MTVALIEGARLELRRDEVVFDHRGNAEKELDRERRLAEHDAAWPPELVGYLWHWFEELSDWRDSGFGVGPVSHLEMECWGRMIGLDPPMSPYEFSVLRTLDRECRAWCAEKSEPKKPQSVGESIRAVAEAHREQKRGRNVG